MSERVSSVLTTIAGGSAIVFGISVYLCMAAGMVALGFYFLRFAGVIAP